MNQYISQIIDDHCEELCKLAENIWNNPEMGWKETKAVAWTAEVLRNNGFETEVGAYNMPTCIRAVYGSGHPVVGFCAEYDCLPGLSQEVCSYQKTVIPNGDGHGCGHNLLGAGCLGACIGLKEALIREGMKGTVIFYGCPAEEQLLGKGIMAKNGAFKECDFTIAWHPSTISGDTLGSHTGVEGLTVEFFGKTSHAAGAPYLGRSALDALQLMNIGVEFLREHVTSDVRMHYIITDGGLAPNIVPDHAQAKYFVRALSRKATTDAYERVCKCAEGAAIMTDTKVKITRLGGLYPTLQNTVIAEAVQEARREIPVNTYTAEELAFADEMNQTQPAYVKEKTLPLRSEDEPLKNEPIYGSTDYGDVEYICPGFQVNECTAPSLSPGHSWMMTASSGHSIGMKGMLRAAKIQALAAYKMMVDPKRLQRAKEEFRQSLNGEEYICPIDDSIPDPYASKE